MFWPQKLTMAKPLITFFSAVLLVTIASAGPYADLQQQLTHAKSNEEVVRLVKLSKVASSNDEFVHEINSLSDSDTDKGDVANNLKSMAAIAASAEQPHDSNVTSALAKKIKESPFYADQGANRKENWLGKALERLKNLNARKKEKEDSKMPNLGPLGQLLYYFLWTLLVGAVLFLLYYLFRYLDWRNALTRKSKAMLEEDEPERTVDEWLAHADELAAAGKYREAVRALYLACLLRFDEHGIARFERGETNWEHLNRFEASKFRPEGLDFREPTSRFDRIWYGHQVKGMADVDEFRGVYNLVTSTLAGEK